MTSNKEDFMNKLNLEKDKLTTVEKEYMKRIADQNLDRVKRFEAIRRKNRWTGLGLGIGVISIYLYSMMSIKQENFLDDFEEPEKISN